MTKFDGELLDVADMMIETMQDKIERVDFVLDNFKKLRGNKLSADLKTVAVLLDGKKFVLASVHATWPIKNGTLTMPTNVPFTAYTLST